MTKPKVLITRDEIPKVVVELLWEKFDVVYCPFPKSAPIEDYLVQYVGGVDALCCMSTDIISKKVIEAAGPQLKIVATFSLGIEHIDLDACKERNICVTNNANPTYCAIVAEFTVGLLLTVARRFIEADAVTRRGEWTKPSDLSWLVGRGLVNSTVGIVGMGRIGLQVMEIILPFRVAKVLYTHQPVSKADSLGAHYTSFEDLLRESDFVVVTCNLKSKNRGMFDSKAFSLMKRSAVFINTSRGRVVDQEALIEALKSKQIKAAGIDVMYPEPLPPEHELFSLPNLVITPHIGASEELAIEKNSTLTAENIIEVLEGRPPLSPVF